MSTFICDCGHEESEHSSFTQGYGTDSQGKTFCYDCCAKNESDSMVETGKAVLYFTENEVTDWPGRLRFKVLNVNESYHNWAGKRYDYWFVGPDSHLWHGYTVGDMTQIAHCKRTKRIITGKVSKMAGGVGRTGGWYESKA